MDKPWFDMHELIEGHPSSQQILQNIKQVVWILDPGTNRIIFVNLAFETVWGLPCSSLYQDTSTLIKSVHPEDRIKVLSASPDDHRKSLNQTYRILRPDTGQRWISANTFLIQVEASGKPYQVCVAEDITDQNEVDQSLRHALARSREQLTLSRRMSLARKPDVVLKTLMSASELRAAGRANVLFFESPKSGSSREIEVVASWSSALSSTSSSPPDVANEGSLFDDLYLLELIQSSRPTIITEIPKDQRLTPAVRELLQEMQIQTMAVFPLVALGNSLGCLLVLFTKVKHFAPIELRHIKVLVDQATITLYNLQLLETEAESRHEAERANEIKTRFLAMISHELRTPLTSIIGFTTTLLADDVTWEPDEQHDFILTIQQEADRLQELIDHLLDLSRLDAGMLPITQEPHELQEIIDDALPQLRILTSRQSFTTHLPANLPPVYVDAKRIAQVLVNLVRNAATYAPEATEINISASVRGGFVQINVSDQGPGIPASEHKRAFNAFRRGANMDDGATKGAGLGLAICKGLVERHGGRIWIKKKSTLGATFSFTIPLVRANPVEVET